MSRFLETLRGLVITYPRVAIASLTLSGLVLALGARMLGHYWLAMFFASLGLAVSAGYVAGRYKHGRRV